jgi:anti-anti-sigma regulatory factor
MKDDPISFWLSDGLAWVKPTGDGCHLNAPKVKAFAKETMQRGCHSFAVDLCECTGMDEDFIGTLAGTALRLRELGRGQLQIVRCPPELNAQLRSLGLEQLFNM